jgi:hypothetical protein
MQGLSENKPLVYALVGQELFLLMLALQPDEFESFTSMMQIAPMPSFDVCFPFSLLSAFFCSTTLFLFQFKIQIVGLMLLDLFGSVLYARVVRRLFQFKVQKLD